jgi:4-amino-4-deoxy-L-arabinose transferase-like glycosyltransferase
LAAPDQTSEARPWWELLCAVGIVALAAWLRLRALGLAEFKLDETRSVELARRLLDGELPTVGIKSSVGALNPPLFVYLSAIPLAIDDDPLAATAFVAVLGVAAVALTYLVLRRRFGAFAALATAALLATAPWAVLYGRKIWAQDVLPLVTVALLWSLFVVLERARTRVVALVPVLLCVAFQLGFSALALVVPAAVVLLYRGRALHRPALAAGAVAAVLLLAPWLGHEATHGFEDVGELVSGGRGSPASALWADGSVQAARQTVRLLGAGTWDYELGASSGAFDAEAGTEWTLARAAGTAVAVLFAVGLVTSAIRAARGARRVRAWPFVELDADAARRALLLVWPVGIWLSYATSSTDDVYPHYLVVAYPVSFLLAALALSDLARHPRALAVAAAAVGAAVAAYVTFSLSFQRFLDRHGGTAGDYGAVYEDSKTLADELRARRLRAGDDLVVDFLITGGLDRPPAGGTTFVGVHDGLDGSPPPPCDGELRTVGALSSCFPRT